MIKSLRKIEKSKRTSIPKLSHNLHLVKGEHNVVHSHTPVSADEIQKLQDINPEYVDRLFKIIEKSVDIELIEKDLFYKAIEREQENDRLAIEKESETKNKAMTFAFIVISFFIALTTGCFYFGYWEIGSLIITVGLVGILKAIFTQDDKK